MNTLGAAAAIIEFVESKAIDVATIPKSASLKTISSKSP